MLFPFACIFYLLDKTEDIIFSIFDGISNFLSAAVDMSCKWQGNKKKRKKTYLDF